MNFQPIEPAHKRIIESYLQKKDYLVGEYSFNTMYIWQDTTRTTFAEHGGFLVLRCYDEDATRFLMPVGEGDLAELLARLHEYAKKQRLPLRFYCINSDMAGEIRAALGCDAPLLHRREHDDYIYRSEDLIGLAGRKYHQKRNHINKFKSLYNFTYEPVTSENLPECYEMNRRWYKMHEMDHDQRLIWEKRAIKRCFRDFDRLGMMGGLIRIDGKVVAFTIASRPHPKSSWVSIHFEKAMPGYDGLYTAINQMFAQAACSRIPLINREEDMGIEGLRKAKLSYHPYILMEKFELLADECP